MPDLIFILLSNLAYPTGLIASPTAIKKSGKDFGRNPVGTGAFMFDNWRDIRWCDLGHDPSYFKNKIQYK